MCQTGPGQGWYPREAVWSREGDILGWKTELLGAHTQGGGEQGSRAGR